MDQGPLGSSRWRVAAASIRGSSHEKTGQPCQDACGVRALPAGVLIVAVADGAGSAPLSGIGAAIAVETALEVIAAAPPPDGAEGWQSLLRTALREARAGVEQAAALRQARPRDLATTLILVAATPALVAAAQVGDGAAVVADRAGGLVALTRPASGEYINETTFLISPDAVEGAAMAVHPAGATHLAVFSDGIQPLALKAPENNPHAPFFTPLFRFLSESQDQASANAELATFLGSERVRQRTDDDLTLVLATLIDEAQDGDAGQV